MSLTKKLLENEFYEYSEAPCLHWMEQEFYHSLAVNNIVHNSQMPEINPKPIHREKDKTRGLHERNNK